MTSRHLSTTITIPRCYSASRQDRGWRGSKSEGKRHASVASRGKNHVATPKNRSVIKAFALLKSFRDAEEWVSSSELSRRAGLPEASGYRLIQTLEEIGAVAR